MRQIVVDDEVWAYLRAKAEPFVDKEPNQVLRRLLGINGGTESPKGPAPKLSDMSGTKRQKQLKANVPQLIKSGLLKLGQPLYLMDYRGQIHRSMAASVAGQDLNYKGRRVSMSALAEELLKQLGHQSSAVRGPAHWATEDGITIKDIWEKYLDA